MNEPHHFRALLRLLVLLVWLCKPLQVWLHEIRIEKSESALEKLHETHRAMGAQTRASLRTCDGGCVYLEVIRDLSCG